jgi:uncharacterized lipoprotein YddW (UPF0748 family)
MIKHINYLTASFLIAILLVPALTNAQFVQEPQSERPKHELRAVWLTTAFGLDWPKGSTPQEQQNSLRNIIANSAAMDLNAIVFQVTARGDAHYKSERLPWASRLTGTLGEDPGWDPLEFLIDEARKYGMEVHAWYNVFNIGLQNDTISYKAAAIPHVFATNREYVRLVGENEMWLNPGIPAARQWAIDNVLEIVQNYDVDAVHFDFIRYPQGGFPDDSQIRSQHNANNIFLLSDWRRDNVTQFNRDVYAAVKEIKPWVKVGSTPVGHYQQSGGWPALFAYSAVFQDGPAWLREGVNDYIAPQLYWAIGSPFPDFNWLVKDWKNRDSGRHIYVGIGAYRAGGSDSQNIASEMGRQIDTLRVDGIPGHIFFRYDNIYRFNVLLSRDAARLKYNGPALVPTMDWFQQDVPNSPTGLTAIRSGGNVAVSWNPVDFVAANGDNKIIYALYRAESASVPDPDDFIGDAANLIAITGETSFTDPLPFASPRYHYFVTAVSRNWVESMPSDVAEAPTASSVDGTDAIASSYRLEQNFPNPFNPVTTIRYEIPESEFVTLAVFDITGRQVAVLENSVRPAGVHSVRFNGASLSSGVYIYRLQTNSVQLTGKMMLVK